MLGYGVTTGEAQPFLVICRWLVLFYLWHEDDGHSGTKSQESSFKANSSREHMSCAWNTWSMNVFHSFLTFILATIVIMPYCTFVYACCLQCIYVCKYI